MDDLEGKPTIFGNIHIFLQKEGNINNEPSLNPWNEVDFLEVFGHLSAGNFWRWRLYQLGIDINALSLFHLYSIIQGWGRVKVAIMTILKQQVNGAQKCSYFFGKSF